MPVKSPTGRSAYTRRYAARGLRAEASQPVAGGRRTRGPGVESPVAEWDTDSAPSLFESRQTVIVHVGSSQVEGDAPEIVGVLNRVPEQQMDAAEPMPRGVRGAVFVGQSRAMAQSHHRSDGLSAITGDPNFHLFTETGSQDVKPRDRLRRQAVALTRQH